MTCDKVHLMLLSLWSTAFNRLPTLTQQWEKLRVLCNWHHQTPFRLEAPWDNCVICQLFTYIQFSIALWPMWYPHTYICSKFDIDITDLDMIIDCIFLMNSISLFGLQWRGCVSEFGLLRHCEYFRVNRCLIKHLMKMIPTNCWSNALLPRFSYKC